VALKKIDLASEPNSHSLLILRFAIPGFGSGSTAAGRAATTPNVLIKTLRDDLKVGMAVLRRAAQRYPKYRD
jgi:hypothetical protein